MSFVVSANYRNRDSENRWLFRKEDEELELATEVKWLTMSNVTFRVSQEEAGFGCARVAKTEAVSVGPRSNLIQGGYRRISFNGYDFTFKNSVGTTLIVDSVQTMYLGKDGRMWGLGINEPFIDPQG